MCIRLSDFLNFNNFNISGCLVCGASSCRGAENVPRSISRSFSCTAPGRRRPQQFETEKNWDNIGTILLKKKVITCNYGKNMCVTFPMCEFVNKNENTLQLHLGKLWHVREKGRKCSEKWSIVESYFKTICQRIPKDIWQVWAVDPQSQFRKRLKIKVSKGVWVWEKFLVSALTLACILDFVAKYMCIYIIMYIYIYTNIYIYTYIYI